MNKEEIIKLLADINSSDTLIRNFSTSIFLNIKDEETIDFLFAEIKNANEYIKSLFIKLITAGKKKKGKKYLIELLRDASPSVRNEAAAAVKKNTLLFTAEDYKNMLQPQNTHEIRLAALDSLIENPYASLNDEIRTLFFASFPAPEELREFSAAIKYACINASNDKKIIKGLTDIIVKSFNRPDGMAVLKRACEYAHLLIDEKSLIGIYRENAFTRGAEICAIIGNAVLRFKTTSAYDFLSELIRRPEMQENALLEKCAAKLIESGEKRYIIQCLELFFTDTRHKPETKFSVYCAILNVNRKILNEIIIDAAAKTRHNKNSLLEYLALAGAAAIKTRTCAQFIIKCHSEYIDNGIKNMALEILYRNNFNYLIDEEFIDRMLRTYMTGAADTIKYSIIPLLVKYLQPARLETLFSKCLGGADDFRLFCEAYLKKSAKGPEFDERCGGYDFYKKVIKAIFEYRGMDLIAGAACNAPYKGVIDFIHEYASAIELHNCRLYRSIIRRTIISALKNIPEAAAHFIRGASNGREILYTGLLKETGDMESLKAIAAFFFGNNAENGLNEVGIKRHPEGPIYYAVKDAIYYIVKNNVSAISSAAFWPEFKNDDFAFLTAAAFINALKEAGDISNEDYGPIYLKNNTNMSFYKIIIKKITFEDKFNFYNILQKNGGEKALEIINELG